MGRDLSSYIFILTLSVVVMSSRDKLDEELAISLKKALVPDESAPKQKHVRTCILYTWQMKGSGRFWTAIKTYPMMSDQVVIFKVLIIIHKVTRQGHADVIIFYYSYLVVDFT